MSTANFTCDPCGSSVGSGVCVGGSGVCVGGSGVCVGGSEREMDREKE